MFLGQFRGLPLFKSKKNVLQHLGQKRGVCFDMACYQKFRTFRHSVADQARLSALHL
jgi:hypothetical protein